MKIDNLSNHMRPKTLDDLIGQKHLKFLFSKIIDLKDNTSFIFYGPSGTGKTSSSIIIAEGMNKKWDLFNATIENKDSLLEKIANNDILIIDEIHRLNKDKQDLLLSYLESREIIVYATTTENPYHKINPAIRSRMQIIQFSQISEEEIKEGILKTLKKNNVQLEISKEALDALVRSSNGDLRSSINNLNLIVKLSKNRVVDENMIKKLIPNINILSDNNGDNHYDYLSAFHKSVRGSDVDAALYYGALILESGDLDGLFRRILCIAYEDISLANPLIALKAESAIRVAERLGLPEMKLPIGNIIVELALSPKSNSTYKAFSRALQAVNEGKIYSIPKHLKDSHYKSASKLGNGMNYKYPHEFENSFVEQQYLPKELINETFFEYGNNKQEKKIKEYWNLIKKK